MEKVLVLNADYSPLNITSVFRGFILVDKGKAEILKSSDNPLKAGEKEYVKPLIIRLLNYVKYRVHNLRINRSRLFKRDGHKCGYCGSKKNLTVDHIIPKSRGGGNTWTNLVTCCSQCNSRKDNKTPEEANMKLNVTPYSPNIFSEIINSSVEHVWLEFQRTFF